MRIPALARSRLACPVLAALSAAAVIAAGQAPAETFIGSGRAEFTVRSWSTDAEREALLTVLKAEKDPYVANKKMLAVIEKMPVKAGSEAAADWTGSGLRLAFQTPLAGGGRRILLVTNTRTTAQLERAVTNKQAEYPFKVVELRLDQTDRGVGTIHDLARFAIGKDGDFVVEHYRKPREISDIHKK